MRRAQKKQAESFLKVLGQAHDEIKKLMEGQNYEAAMDLLGQCQEGALKLGEMIEREEGEGFAAISLLEDYCEQVYQVYDALAQGQEVNAHQATKRLKRSQIQVENCIRNEVKVRLEIAFLPYKASMWDSMESVWQAAEADPDCDAYVVPIPYYDRNPDGSLGIRHYEGEELPSDVPVTHYDAYPLEERRPDVIYIHNPYDYTNYVTSIAPEYYSSELKKYTECLVYIPYYSTAGGMSEGQMSCPVYYYADYIIIQAEKYRKFFDPALPKEKLLPLGSPKFDRVIRMCANPPKPPKEWEEKRKGRKVYFYNTSLGGMLGDTKRFLDKMAYVFRCFEGREDACLLWRPHPLLESTFESMRLEDKARFDQLKQKFIKENIGIYDDTPDITSTIAFSDVYIGDAGTSVTSLFGVAGKPMFILNNQINTLPEKEDWRGEKVNLAFDGWGDDRYQIIGNQLWYSENNDYHYHFYMDLGTGYSGGRYYMGAVEIKGKIYVLPANAQHLLIIKNKKIRKVLFKDPIVQIGAFNSYYYDDNYIFLFPNQYPFMIRFNIRTEEIHYIEGIRQFYMRHIEGEWRGGGIGLYGNELVFASPEDNTFVFMDKDTLKARGMCSNSESGLGTQGIVPEGDNLWLMPLNGMVITCWNPKTGEVKEYDDLPEDFRSIRWPYEEECEERPFGMIAYSKEGKKAGKETIIISPTWGNMYLTLDRETGKMEKWEPPIPFTNRGKNGYFATSGMGGFVITWPQMGKVDCRIWYAPERRLYDINIDTKEYREVEIIFDEEELKSHEPGFMEDSEWLQYCLGENAFNSLEDLLNGRITGKPFDRERQLKAYSKINVNTSGTCGEQVHRSIKKKLQEKGSS